MTARDWLDLLDKRPCERSPWDLKHITAHLHQVAPLRFLPLALLEELARYIFFECLDTGVTVCHAGDFGTNWYIVLSGTLELIPIDAEEGATCDPEAGNIDQDLLEQKIEIRCGSTFGESVVTNAPRKATIVTKENCQLLRVEQDDFRNLWEVGLQEEKNQELMENLVSGIGKREDTETKASSVGKEIETFIKPSPVVSSSGEESEESEKRVVQKKKIGNNWSPRAALRNLGSLRRKDSRKELDLDSRPAPTQHRILPVIHNASPARKNSSTLRLAEESPLESPTKSLLQPATKLATDSSVPEDIKWKNQSLLNLPSKLKLLEKEERRSTLPDTSIVNPPEVHNKRGSQSKEPVSINSESVPINSETLKQNIKLPISSKRFSENPIKSLSRSGLSPSALKKAFQFTRSSSWTQKKLANASPTGGQKSLNITPKRKPSLVRASSFDTSPDGAPVKIHDLKISNQESSFDTPEEDEEESLPGEVANESKWTKKERGSIQHDRSQELDSPSNAAQPILEAPSVRVCEAAWVLRSAILHKASNMLQDRRVGHSTVARCAIGSELTEWLTSLSASIQSRAQAASMWQVLLEEGALVHVTGEQPFRDKYLFYRFLEDNSAQIGESLLSPSSQEKRDAEERLPSIIAFLTQKAPDAALRLILRKPSHERTLEDQELIFEELLHLKAVSHLTNSVKRELSAVIKFESHMREGTILFEQGSEGKSWYIIVRGSVDVDILGKGVVTTLQEGDDFGKLALVNDAPRAATIILKEDNCQFLRVDKGDFNRILRDVEANTVRLKEHGKDVLVLEKVSSSHTHSQFKYSVMAGTAQKMLEHLLETRLDGRKMGGTDTLSMGVGVAVGMGMAMGASMGVSTDESHLPIRKCDLSSSDFFLDDFLLTHIVFMPYSQLTQSLFEHYRVSGTSANPDEAFTIACKKRVVHFTHRWVMTISDPIFANKDASKFLQDLKTEVEEDCKTFGSALREEMSLMLSSYESLERYDQEVSSAGVSKWKLPTSGKPISLFGASTLEDSDEVHRKIHAHDDIIFRVYCADHTYCTLRFPLSANAETVKRSAADKLGLSLENLVLVELKSNGDTAIINDKEVCVPTGITINGRLFVAHKDHLDALTTLPDQEGPKEGTLTQLEMFSTKELAYHITSYDWDLFITIHEYEFLYEVFGRGYFGEVMCNLDVFKRRFNEIQFWVATEVCLANTLSKRTQLLRKFIKLAAYCKEMQNLNAFFAIVMGLSNVSVSRMTQTWERLSSRFRKMFIEFEMLIDPSRNHRSYRLYVAKLHPPIVPFTPLLMKDMTFTHDGNRTFIEGLINFEKMHMLAQTLRTVRYCRSKNLNLDPPSVPKNENEVRLYVRDLHIIDSQKRLIMLSQRNEPKRP